MNWYIKVLKQYTDFNGRARRKEYWMFTLFSSIIAIVIGFLSGIIAFVSDNVSFAQVPGYIYNLAVFLPSIAVGVRRMHDVGKSGWFLLIPFYNLYLLCIDGNVGENKYGSNPKNPESELNEIGAVQA